VDHLDARLLAEHPDLDLERDLAPLAGWPVQRFRLLRGMISALGPALEATVTRAADLPADARLLAAAPTLDLIVAADGDVLVVQAGTAWRLPVPEADSATMLPSGQLIVTAPVIGQSAAFGRARGAHRVLLLDPEAREILDEATLDVTDGYATAALHPSDGSVLLDVGLGQDGGCLYAVRVAGRELVVDLILRDVIAGGFSPSGDRLLLTPPPNAGDDLVRILKWPSLEPTAGIIPARSASPGMTSTPTAASSARTRCS